jgi:hypothetical protein
MGRRMGDALHLGRAEVIFNEIGAELDLAQVQKLLKRES